MKLNRIIISFGIILICLICSVVDSKSSLLSPNSVLASTKTIETKSSKISIVSSEDKVSFDFRGPSCILGGALAHLTLGTLYCWGNFISYCPQNLKFFDGKSHPGSQPDALYVIPLTILFQAIAMPFGPSLVKAIGSRRTMLLGSWLTALATYLASFQKDLASFMLFYSALFGIGAGLAYVSPMIAGF